MCAGNFIFIKKCGNFVAEIIYYFIDHGKENRKSSSHTNITSQSLREKNTCLDG